MGSMEINAPWKILLSAFMTELEQVTTCFAQTSNQNTNVALEVCKVVFKRTSGLTVKIIKSRLEKVHNLNS